MISDLARAESDSMKQMLDLFSGLGGASQAFQDSKGWEVTMVDIEPRFKPDICADVLVLDPKDFRDFNLVWASPPCPCFSVAAIPYYWDGFPVPLKKEVAENIKLVFHTLWLINQLKPEWWFLENPMGMLRNVIGRPHGTITLCQYGDNRMKPTDLWGRPPPSFPFKRCMNQDPCHDSAPRGSHEGGTQASTRNAAERAKMPYGLSEAILKAVEDPYETGQRTLKEVLE